MSTFSGINLTSKALAAAQRSMEVTGQNIANANTPGYSRQRVDQTESVVGEGGIWARRNIAGDGVEITGISRATDAFVDARQRQDAATSAEQQATAKVWNDVETGLGEPGSASLTQRLTDTYKSWSDLGNAQGSDAVSSARTTVLSRSQAVVDTLKGLDESLTQQWGNLRDNASVLAEDASGTAARVAELNNTIRKALNTGSSANELLDQRDQAVNHLAELTGARVVQRDGGMVDVYVGNAAIVTGDRSETLSVRNPGLTLAQAKGAGAQALQLQVGATAVSPDSGTLRATLDAVNTTLPGVSGKYADTAQKIADEVNAVYNPAGTAGGDFFAFDATKGAGGLSVLVAGTSDAQFADSTPGTVDRSIAKTLGQLPENPAKSPSTSWRSTVTSLASSSQAAESRADLAASVALKSSAAREAVSGVNLDEEMTNLVTFQNAYSAAARVLTAIDEALDTLINRTGLVGR